MFYRGIRKRVAKLLSTVLVVSSILPSAVFGAELPFIDTAGSYAQKEISSLIEDGIISGYEDNSFRPNQAITRAELAKIIVSSMGLAENGAKAAPFADVAEDSWYRGYVGALVESGITQGTSSTQFSPDTQVTREALVVFFVRAFGLEETAKLFSADSAFTDVSDVSDWARPHVALAYRMGFVGGSEDAEGKLRFNPKDNAERQALARLAYEFKTNKLSFVDKARQLAAGKSSTGADAVSSLIASITAVSNTSIEVAFVSVVTGVNKADFVFDNDLAVVDAALKEGSTTVVVLTTGIQTAGTSYKLTYRGSQTGKVAAGIGGFFGGGGGGGGGSKSTTPAPTVAEQLAAGGTLSDVTIKSSGAYGPADGSGKTTTVTGTLTIDPGPDGEVTLQHINPAKLDVLSGKDESIKLQQTVIKQLRVNAVNNGGRDVRIEAQDDTSVESTEVESQAVLESSSTTGKLGTIKLTSAATGKSLTLKGNIDGDVTVEAPGSTVKLAPPSSGNSQPTVIKNLKVGANSTISSGTGTTISQVNVTAPNTRLNLEGAGTISSIQVDSTAGGSMLTIGEGSNVESVQSDTDVTLTGNAEAIAAVNIEGQVKLDETIKDRVKETATANAISLIKDLGIFSSYSLELQTKLDHALAAVEKARSYGVGDESLQPEIGKLVSIQQSVDSLKEEVSSAQKSLEPGYKSGDTAAGVYNDLALPVKGIQGTSITWTSSHAVIDPKSGKVTRPDGSGNAVVTLTANIYKNGYSLDKTFVVTVVELRTGLSPKLVSAQSNDYHEGIDGRDFTISWYPADAAEITTHLLYILPVDAGLLDRDKHTPVAVVQDKSITEWTGNEATLDSSNAPLRQGNYRVYVAGSTADRTKLYASSIVYEPSVIVKAAGGSQLDLMHHTIQLSPVYLTFGKAVSETSASNGSAEVTIDGSNYRLELWSQGSEPSKLAINNSTVYDMNTINLEMDQYLLAFNKTFEIRMYRNGSSSPVPFATKSFQPYTEPFITSVKDRDNNPGVDGRDFTVNWIPSYVEDIVEQKLYIVPNDKWMDDIETLAPTATFAGNTDRQWTGNTQSLDSYGQRLEERNYYVYIVAVDKLGRRFEFTETFIPEQPLSSVPTVDTELFYTTDQIVGHAKRNARVILRTMEGVPFATGNTDSDGVYKLQLRKNYHLSGLTTVQLSAKETDKAESDPIILQVTPASGLPSPSVTGVVYEDGGILEVTAVPYTYIRITRSDGSMLMWKEVDASGKFTTKDGLRRSFIAGEKLAVSAFNMFDYVSDPVLITVQPVMETTAIPTVTGTVYNTGLSTIIGTAEPGSDITISKTNGEFVYSTRVKTDGSFSLTFSGANYSITAGEQLAVAADSIGKKISSPVFITVANRSESAQDEAYAALAALRNACREQVKQLTGKYIAEFASPEKLNGVLAEIIAKDNQCKADFEAIVGKAKSQGVGDSVIQGYRDQYQNDRSSALQEAAAIIKAATP
jgi:hypothetical protein